MHATYCKIHEVSPHTQLQYRLWRVNLVCQTQIINGVDRPDPTDHKYLKLKRVKFSEKKMYPETLKPQPRLKCYLYHNFFFSLSILLSRFKQSKLSFPVYYVGHKEVTLSNCKPRNVNQSTSQKNFRVLLMSQKHCRGLSQCHKITVTDSMS